MTLYNKIQEDHIAARKNNDTVTTKVLSTLLGELQQSANVVDGEKVIRDSAVVSTIKAWVKRYDATINSNAPPAFVALCREERNIISKYLPQQLTEEELTVIIQNQVDNGSGMPEIMKHLKEQYAGLYDGKTASQLAKNMSS